MKDFTTWVLGSGALVLTLLISAKSFAEAVPVEGCPSFRYVVTVKQGSCHALEIQRAENNALLTQLPGHAGIYEFSASSTVDLNEVCRKNSPETCSTARLVRVCTYKAHRWATRTQNASGKLDISGDWVEKIAPSMVMSIPLSKDGALDMSNKQIVLDIAKTFKGSEICSTVDLPPER